MNRPIKHNPDKQKGAIEIRRLVPAREVMNGRIKRAVRLAGGNRNLKALSVVLGDDVTLASLHQRYMADASPTDVLTFDLRDDNSAEEIEGEVVVSVETARREARRRKIEVGQELLRYIIHGTLHLVGYDDRTTGERRRMQQEEDRVLGLLNVTKPTKGPRVRSALRK